MDNTECTLPETTAENGTPTANVMYPLHTCPSFKVASSELVHCLACCFTPPMMSRIKTHMPFSRSSSVTTKTFTIFLFHNDLLYYLFSRAPPHSGCSRSSSGRRCFFPSCVVDSKSVLLSMQYYAVLYQDNGRWLFKGHPSIHVLSLCLKGIIPT